MKSDQKVVENISKARSLMAKNCYKEAEALYLQALKCSDEKEKLLTDLVKLYWVSGKVDRAIDCLEDLIKLDAKNLGYYLDLASVCEMAGYVERGIFSYQRLLKINPELPNSWYNLGRLHKKNGAYQEALESYSRALKFGASRQEEIYNNIAAIYSELNQEEQAIQYLELALNINPAYIPALYNLGARLEEQGKKDQAVLRYRQVLSQDKYYYPALCRLANMIDVADSNDPIIRDLEGALSQSGLDTEIKEELLFAYGKLMDECGNFGLAFESYRKANELGENRFPVYDKRVQEERIDKVIQVFARSGVPACDSGIDVGPLFICGMYRSGSTLVEQILNAHSRVSAYGELDFFPNLVSKLYSEGKLEDYYANQKLLAEVAEDYLSLMKCRFGSFDVVTDKRPDNFMHVGLIKKVFPQGKFIWTKRDLLDNCLSIYFQYLGGNMNYSTSLDAIGHYYTQQVRLMEYWKLMFPGSIFEVQYERLVENPENEIRSLLRFLGLEWEGSCLEFYLGDNHVKTASVWQVRKSIYKSSSGRSKNYIKYLEELNRYLHDLV